MDVGRENEAAAVPGLGSVARDLGVMRDQLPAGEVIEEGALAVLKDGDIEVNVIAGLATEPGVDGPAAAEGPSGTKRRHELRDAGDGFRDGGHGLAVRAMGISKHRYSPYHAKNGMIARGRTRVDERKVALGREPS